MADTKKKYWVGCVLGESAQDTEEREFNTPEEVEAFMDGVNCAVGWMDIREWFLEGNEGDRERFGKLVRNDETGIVETPEEEEDG